MRSAAIIEMTFTNSQRLPVITLMFAWSYPLIATVSKLDVEVASTTSFHPLAFLEH